MKYTIILLTLLLINGLALAETTQITSFTSLLESLTKGEEVTAIMHYGKCTLVADGKEEGKGPEAIGGMKMMPFEYFAVGSVHNKKAYVSCSENILISMPSGYVYDYVKIRIFDDNTIEIVARYLSPKDLEVKMDEKFLTTINDGKNEGGVSFFHQSK